MTVTNPYPLEYVDKPGATTAYAAWREGRAAGVAAERERIVKLLRENDDARRRSGFHSIHDRSINLIERGTP